MNWTCTKGYPTKRHYELLDQYGVQPFYRKKLFEKNGAMFDGRKKSSAGRARRWPGGIMKKAVIPCWEMNYRTRMGEVDVIAQKGRPLCIL